MSTDLREARFSRVLIVFESPIFRLLKPRSWGVKLRPDTRLQSDFSRPYIGIVAASNGSQERFGYRAVGFERMLAIVASRTAVRDT